MTNPVARLFTQRKREPTIGFWRLALIGWYMPRCTASQCPLVAGVDPYDSGWHEPERRLAAYAQEQTGQAVTGRLDEALKDLLRPCLPQRWSPDAPLPA